MLHISPSGMVSKPHILVHVLRERQAFFLFSSIAFVQTTSFSQRSHSFHVYLWLRRTGFSMLTIEPHSSAFASPVDLLMDSSSTKKKKHRIDGKREKKTSSNFKYASAGVCAFLLFAAFCKNQIQIFKNNREWGRKKARGMNKMEHDTEWLVSRLWFFKCDVNRGIDSLFDLRLVSKRWMQFEYVNKCFGWCRRCFFFFCPPVCVSLSFLFFWYFC